MEIRIRLLGTFKEFSEEAICLRYEKEPDLGEVIDRLVLELGPAFERAFLDPILHDPSPRALILVNGVEIGVLRGLETTLSEGDDVVVLPVSHGG